MLRKTRLVALLAIAATAGCKDKGEREAYAVGTHMGGGSVLTGSSSCTYEAPAEVAELARNEAGEAFMAKLVGPGTVTQICGSEKSIFDVVVPTALVITGPDEVKAGTTSEGAYAVVLLAGSRQLRGVRQGSPSPDWQLAPGCEGGAEFAPVLGSQDTGGRSIVRNLMAKKAGTCTITASLLGLRASKAVSIE